MDSPFFKGASEGASATKEFHKGTDREKKLNLKEFVNVEYCLNFLLYADLIFAVIRVSYLVAGTSTRS